MLHSSLTIRIMLACYASPDPARMLGADEWTSEPAGDARLFLYTNKLINLEWGVTDRGRKWVEMICDTPLPVDVVWVAPREPASGDDGWISHDGGPCPVPPEAQASVKLRGSGVLKSKRAENFDWTHTGTLGDIIAYKVHS